MRYSIHALVGLAATLGLASVAWATESDADFAKKAASDGQLEVELGKYAAANAANAEVKRFARMMVDDHSKANQQLTDLAKRQNIPLQTSLSTDDRDTATQLMKLRGAEFDRAYVKAMVKDHEKAVKDFSAQADEKKSDIDRWAATTLPKLREHLEHARELEQKTGQDVSSAN